MTTTRVEHVESPEPTDAPPNRRPLPGDRARMPVYLFALVEVVAIPTFLWIGRGQWFFLDEWDFLATRDARSLDDLLSPHFQHWTTVPIISYRLLWSIFGLHEYWPYQLVAVLAHVAVAALLFVVMRRVGVNPWITTAAASLFALFGSGSGNVIWAFQITFIGALMFGLLQLCLADHAGAIGWRDLAALGAGMLALMCSGVGLTMLAIVGVAIFLRRGWRAAALQVVPLGLVYLAWFATYGKDAATPDNSSTRRQVLDFVGESLTSTYRDMGQLPGLGVVLAIVLVVGGVLLCRSYGVLDVLQRFAAPIVLGAGSVVFAVSAAEARADLIGAAPSLPRYVYVVAAMSIPAIALCADAVARRWSVLFPVIVALFVVPIPFGLYHARDPNPHGDPTVVALVQMDDLDGVPPDTPVAIHAGRAELTLGWLRTAGQRGKVPRLEPDRQKRAEVNWRLWLALHQTSDHATGACTPIDTYTDLSLTLGDTLGISGGPVIVTTNEWGGSPFNSVRLHPALGETLVVQVASAHLRFWSADPRRPASLCRG
jgi:hypothetical protein